MDASKLESEWEGCTVAGAVDLGSLLPANGPEKKSLKALAAALLPGCPEWKSQSATMSNWENVPLAAPLQVLHCAHRAVHVSRVCGRAGVRGDGCVGVACAACRNGAFRGTRAHARLLAASSSCTG